MGHKKQFDELSASTQAKYLNVNYTRVWDEEADDIARNADPRTAQVFLYLQPILRLANGYLARDGQAITSQELSRRMGVTKGVIGSALRELQDLGIFDRIEKNGAYFSKRLVSLYKNRQTQENPDKNDSVGGTSSREQEEKMIPKVSVEVGESSLGETRHTDTIVTHGTDKKGGAGATRPRAADADGLALLKDCWSIPNVNIAAEITPGFVAGLAAQIGVADAATSFRKLCASHIKNDKPVEVWNVEAWFKNEGKRKAKQQPHPAGPQAEAPKPTPAKQKKVYTGRV